MNALPYLIQGSNIVVIVGNKSYTISKTNISYEKVKEAIKIGDWDAVKELVNPAKIVLKYGKGNVSIQGETLYWRGKEFNTALSVRMIAMLQEGFPIEPMVQFMENLMSNPSNRAVNELYPFLEKCNLPITPDGHFLAFKKVRDNYTDVHSGTMDNSIGQIVEMERNMVDDNRAQTCSTGLHFCSQSYLSSFGGSRTVIVKVNPRDVVSVPSDHNDAKARCCRYEVIGELNVEPGEAFTKPVQSTAVGSQPVPKPVNRGPKMGSTPFYNGYTDGFDDSVYAAVVGTSKDRQDYSEGYNKGAYDFGVGKSERYQYVSVPKAESSLNPAGAWPFPHNNNATVDPKNGTAKKQDYDYSGRPLSMTKNAIRKRELRMEERIRRNNRMF